MTDAPQTAAAPAAATSQPAAAPANTTVQRAPGGQAETPAEKAARESRNPNFVPAQGAAPTPKVQGRSSLITNPAPVVDENAPVADALVPDTLPASTLAEMEAGKEALKRHASPHRTRRETSKEEAAKTDVSKDAASKE